MLCELLKLYTVLQDFVTGLSVLARGTVEEKLEWAFGLYDINGDGVIGRDEMFSIVTSIYDMIGKCAVPSFDECAIIQHVDHIFQVYSLRQFNKSVIFVVLSYIWVLILLFLSSA